ncbi:hypothetical protein [Stenotrophomonas oahuensis]|uniref:Uncharacterized protein n=1 Tax=Stenotrophomonas oahuensis TaxID=3003271 RepID=A0ABY9YKV9_9GAMM|nr:hypothetical protein [Stenotrophomonas sp. A5586]WNH50948.1 hypothetical protein PDM29_11155 [Stenotrophomonas sp. A5586]
MTITSILTQIFKPATYAAQKAVAHPEEFKRGIAALLKNIKNLNPSPEDSSNVCVRSNLAFSNLWKLETFNQSPHDGGTPLDVATAKEQLSYVKSLKRDFKSQFEDVLKSNGRRDCWYRDQVTPLKELYGEASKLQHFNHRDYGQQKSQ